ncbi:nitrate reductase [Rhizobium straminoryzae]|uniref:Molybdopterin-dependent oxidoreductase n=1 Tax=Rhizobium straminoryzae TaxID=1387186 RepID=A0A549TBG2_9HYPH|nr:nitrate reductase [Rhizobium straminoryzae]TRL39220.1 molybdopterin-dependent oxidoreductase [Rhizobium straminoryzae]
MPAETRTTCPYCGVGCGVIARVEDDGRVSVRGDPEHPANFGRLCSKGSALAETLDPAGRAHSPMLHGRPVSWDTALDAVATAFSDAIRDHGPDSVAFYLSGQLLTEDYYVANKLMKGFLGSANIDTNSRLCMASSVAGHRRAFGSDTVPGTYEDLELADLVVLVGSNMAWCHPVLYQRLAVAKAARPSMKVVVIDPRRTASSDLADLHLAIRPDGDVALFNGLLAHLAETGAIDEDFVAAHTSGFAQALMAAGRADPATIAEVTGLPAQQIRQFLALFAATEKVVTCYSQGVNQSSVGSDKVNGLINCHLATGRIGRPGMGPFSLTGQPNAMGGREVGGLANMLAAHMAIENPQDRDRVQRFWKAPAIADRPGLKAVDLFEAVADGRIKALWIMSTNPVVSMPDADRVKAAIETCPFVVVSDIEMHTDTARLAHVLLPATGWGEKNGTVTNSERRISRQRAFLPPPGEARPDWWQMADVARRMGFEDAFAYPGPHAIFAEHAALSAFENGGSRDFDIGAHADATEAEYAALTPFQWPQPAQAMPDADRRFFGDGRFFHPDRRARFVAVTAAAETRTSPAFPFVLNTGRVRDHWHTMTRTGKSARLSAHLAEPFAEIHPHDAAAYGIADADLVELESVTGRRVVVRALLTRRQAPGAVFVPMHWTDETAALGRVDTLIPGRRDPLSGQPALKHAAVSLRRHAAAFHGFAVASSRPLPLPFDYWALARCEGGYRMELAGQPPAEGWQAWLQTAFHLPPQAEVTGYVAREGRELRLAAFGGDRLLALLFVSDEPVAVSRPWAAGQLAEPHPDRRMRTRLIAGRPPADQPDKGAILCSCMGIGVNEIAAAAEGGCSSVQAVGAQTGAGTNCGSCRPEIRKILEDLRRVAAE